jgi:sec-independent protein translocase protein TatC
MVIGPQHTGNSNIWLLPRTFSDYLFDTIIFGPVRQHLPYQFFFELSQSLGLTDSFCITEFPLSSEYLHGGTGKCVYLGLSSCRIYFKFSLYFMEIWKFISPALYKNVKKCKAFIFFLRYFSLLGAVYYIVIPMSVNFVATFKVSDPPQSVYIRLLYWVGKTSVLASGYF